MFLEDPEWVNRLLKSEVSEFVVELRKGYDGTWEWGCKIQAWDEFRVIVERIQTQRFLTHKSSSLPFHHPSAVSGCPFWENKQRLNFALSG